MKKLPIKINGKGFLQNGHTVIVCSQGRVWLNGEEVLAYEANDNQKTKITGESKIELSGN